MIMIIIINDNNNIDNDNDNNNIYLLVIAMSCFERGSQPIGFILVLVSIVRLIVNVTTDEFIYKK